LIEIDTRAWQRNPLRTAIIEDIREKFASLAGRPSTPIEIAIDFQGLIKSGLIARLSGAKRRVGLETEELREKLSRFFLTDQVRTSAFLHVIEKNLALARAAIGMENGGPIFGYEFPISVSSEDEAFAEKAARRFNNRFALLNPGGGWSTKLWPAERYGEIADWLKSSFNIHSVVTFGPGEENLARRAEQGSKTRAATVVASTLKQLVALARRASLFVGGDTGPLHIAAASGTPIVGIYGPTSPERNGPFDRRDICVGIDLWCRPNCHRRACWHWQCMDIPVRRVQQAISMRLEKSNNELSARQHS
jgi:ADP-heptose:LPS heptosyltransferase